MASGNTIIVGGGIASATPFTVGQFPVIVNADPATVSDGNIRQDASSPPKVFIGDATLTAGATVLGGAVATVGAQQSVVIGVGAADNQANNITGGFENVIIGRGSVVNGTVGTANSNVVIGANNVVTGQGFVSNVVMIGRGNTIPSPAGGSNSVMIGSSQSLSLGSQNVMIGSNVTCNANNSNVIIGFASTLSGGATVSSCTIVGSSNSVSAHASVVVGAGNFVNGGSGVGAGMICLGVGISPSNISHAAIIGGTSSAITQVIFGQSNVVANPLEDITVRLHDPSGANMAGAQLTIRPGLSTGAGAQKNIVFATQNTIGAASVLGTVTPQVTILASNGGIGVPNLRFDNVADGAAAAVGTLNNAPSAGNPTFWLPVNIAGNVRYIPCWT